MPTSTEERTTSNWMKEVQKGYIRVATLIVLSRKPSHGYEIMKEIKDKTGGFYRPTPGGVYPILRNLEKAGYIGGEWGTHRNRKIKVYKITEKGEHILKHAVIKQSEITKSINSLIEEFAREVLNIEPEISAMPIMPDPFSDLLQGDTMKKTETEKLEQKQKELERHISMMQEKMKVIDRELTEAKLKG